MYNSYRNFGLSLLLLALACSCNGQEPVVDSPQVNIHQLLTDSAQMHERKGDTKSALTFHKKALHHARISAMPEKEARTLVKIALLLKKEDAGASLQHLKNALAIADSLGHHTLRADILLATSAIYKQQENYKEALIALEAHQRLLNLVFAKNKAHEIALIKTEQSAKLERYTLIGIIVLVLLAAGGMAFYFVRTNALNKQLRASNLIKDKLFSIIGHDLRGPAGGIMEALDMVDSGILDEAEQKEIIGLLKKQSRSFNETLNSLLNWAATQLQGAETQATRFDLKLIVKKSLDVLTGQAKQKNLSIINQVPENLFVHADMNHVDFVVRNLLSNAIKFSYENGNIEVTAKEEGAQVIIAIADHGMGIPKAKQQQFEVSTNYMESSFGTKGESGTGLGLMLSREFLQANKGRMWLESKEGRGTTVFVALSNG